MNQAQMKYAKQRATSIYQGKRKEIIRKFTKEGGSKSNKEMVALVKSGKVKVRANIDFRSYRCTELENIFDFSKYIYGPITDPRSESETEVLKGKYDRLMDELVLGDNAKALELLRYFESM